MSKAKKKKRTMSENEFKALSDVLTAEMKRRENLIILPVTADKLRKTKV